MTLNLSQRWEKEQLEKRLKELKSAGIELISENITRIIDIMSFKTRSKQQSDDCPYYKKERACHPKVKNLNCFLCACPNYESFKLEGGCKIRSKKGKFAFHKNLPKGKIWDCSECTNYHSPQSIEKYLKENIENLRNLSTMEKTQYVPDINSGISIGIEYRYRYVVFMGEHVIYDMEDDRKIIEVIKPEENKSLTESKAIDRLYEINGLRRHLEDSVKSSIDNQE